MPPNTELPQEPDLHFAISPEGTNIAFVARSGNGVTQLYLRSINNFTAQAVPGSENASYPFFSPDGKWIAYCSNNVLYRASVEGLTPTKIGKWKVQPKPSWMPCVGWVWIGTKAPMWVVNMGHTSRRNEPIYIVNGHIGLLRMTMLTNVFAHLKN